MRKVSWYDSRDGAETEGDIYASRIYAKGTTDVETPVSRIASLAQCYLNPFNPHTMICFDLPAESFVGLAVYSVAG